MGTEAEMKSMLLGRGRELEPGLGGAPKDMTNEGQSQYQLGREHRVWEVT